MDDADFGEEYGGADIALTACDKSGTRFCCRPNADDCCKAGNYTEINKYNGQIIAIGTSTLPTSTATPNSSANSSSSATASASTTAADSNDGGSLGGGLTEQGKLGVGLGVGLGVPFR